MENIRIAIDEIGKDSLDASSYGQFLKNPLPHLSQSNIRDAIKQKKYRSNLRWSKAQQMDQPSFKINSAYNSQTSLVNAKSYGNILQKTKKTQLKIAEKSEKMKSKNRFQQPNIRNSIRNYKIQNLGRVFLDKLRRNSVFRIPTQFQPFQDKQPQQQFNNKLQMNKHLKDVYILFNILHGLITIILSTLLCAFVQEFQSMNMHVYFSTVGIICCALELTIKYFKIWFRMPHVSILKKILLLTQTDYAFLDIFTIIVHALVLTKVNIFTPYLYGLLIVRLPYCIEKVRKLQNRFFESPYWQNHWKLFKIVINNSFLAHFIAISFILMTKNSDKNWITEKNIQQSQWYQQYIWAYYWATTTILSVGFGDIAAINCKQAIILVVVQTLGCLTMAYNINCIGSILSQIKAKESQKDKGLNFLRKFCIGHQIDNNLQIKLQNHIKQTFKIQTKHNFDQFNNFTQKLPYNLKQQFLRQAHQKVMMQIPFIKNLTQKTIFSIAQKLVLKVAHPEQIICYSNSQMPIQILKQGEMGYCSSLGSTKYSKTIIDKFEVLENSTSKILSLDYMRPHHLRKYDIKSKTYSIYCQMLIQQFHQILKNKDVDFELYFIEKNKFKPNSQQLQIIKCQNCQNKYHSKFQCPKLHYMPITHLIINKHLHSVKKSFSRRRQMIRAKIRISPYANYNPSIQQTTLEMMNYFRSFDVTMSDGNVNGIIGPKKLMESVNKTRQNENQLKVYDQHRLKTNIIVNATQLMKNQMKNYVSSLLQSKNQFWNLQCDEAHNYKFYFIQMNAQNFEGVQIKRTSFQKSKEATRKNANHIYQTNYY